MPIVSSISIGGGTVEIEFIVNSSNIVTDIAIRNTLPNVHAVRAYIEHVGSGYLFDTELVLGAGPITIKLANPRRFPYDDTATVRLVASGRTVL